MSSSSSLRGNDVRGRLFISIVGVATGLDGHLHHFINFRIIANQCFLKYFMVFTKSRETCKFVFVISSDLAKLDDCNYLLGEGEEEEEGYVPDVRGFASGLRKYRERIRCTRNGDRRRRRLRLLDPDVSAPKETERVLEELVESPPRAAHGSRW